MQQVGATSQTDRFSVWTKRIFLGIASILVAFHIYTAWFGAYTAVVQRSIHLMLVLAAVFVSSAAGRQGAGKGKYFKIISDFLLLGLSLVAVGYIFVNYQDVIRRLGEHTTADIVMGLITMLILLEATRRVFGWILPAIAAVFIAYAFLGDLLPAKVFGHQGFGLDRVVSIMAYSTEGIFGVPLGASATMVAMFMIFASLYNGTNAGDQFLALCEKLFIGLRAGPAKMAVVASSLFGTISGSAVANVVTTGTFTIPLMKRMGFSKEFAGAVEACSSTGGQFIPPVMGAAAFIMAEFLGVSYVTVCLAAVGPAILYYTSLYFMVDLEACRRGLEGTGAKPAYREAFRRSYSLIPIAVLFLLMILIKWSPARSALIAILPIVILDAVSDRRLWKIGKLLDCIRAACRGIIDVAMATACAGLIVGIFSLTGLGLTLSDTIISASSGNIFILMTLTMITSIILGMGITTAAVYIILAVMVAPVMVQTGVQPMAAHMFVFYYGCLSSISPPVAVATYAAAGIAEGNFYRTGFLAIKIALAGFIVPYIFVLDPALIGVGSIVHVTYRVTLSFLAVILASFAIQNSYGLKGHRLGWTWRIINGVTALVLIYPSTAADIIGISGTLMCGIHFFRQRARIKRETALAA